METEGAADAREIEIRERRESEHSEPESIELSLFPVAVRMFLALFTLDTLLALAILLLLVSGWMNLTLHAALVTIWILHTLVFLAVAYLMLKVLLSWGRIRAFIDHEHHLVLRQGITSQHEQVYDLSLLRTVKLDQSAFGKRFNYGNLHLIFGGMGYNTEIDLNEISNPKHFEESLCHYLHARM